MTVSVILGYPCLGCPKDRSPTILGVSPETRMRCTVGASTQKLPILRSHMSEGLYLGLVTMSFHIRRNCRLLKITGISEGKTWFLVSGVMGAMKVV